ncbi:MAG TPA: hypothetical protein PKH07_14310 [bacterium]|nr:hypothetical protein [bacterium]
MSRIKCLLIFPLLAGMLSALVGCGFEMPKDKPVILKAIADNKGDGLAITNDTSFDWNNVTFTINDRYFCTRPIVPSRKTVILNYEEFKDKTGTVFPLDQIPSKYFIESDEGTGPA